MNVVYASNDGYARHLGASMYSLFDRNQLEEEITVYVLSMGLSEDNRRKLGEIAEHFDRTLVILEMVGLVRYSISPASFSYTQVSKPLE